MHDPDFFAGNNGVIYRICLRKYGVTFGLFAHKKTANYPCGMVDNVVVRMNMPHGYFVADGSGFSSFLASISFNCLFSFCSVSYFLSGTLFSSKAIYFSRSFRYFGTRYVSATGQRMVIRSSSFIVVPVILSALPVVVYCFWRPAL